MKRLFLILGLLLGACSNAPQGLAQSFEIKNFKSGLICPKIGSKASENPINGNVCFETETVHVTGQSTCIYDQREILCTWYGYEFDYDELETDVTVNCVYEANMALNQGNPEGVIAENTKRQEFDLTLEKGTSHFFNPMYAGFGYNEVGEDQVSYKTSCSVNDFEIFKYKMATLLPTYVP